MLASSGGDEELVQAGLYCLAAVTRRLEVEGASLQHKDLATVQDLLNDHPNDPYILETGLNPSPPPSACGAALPLLLPAYLRWTGQAHR